MRKIINGKQYDTDTARACGACGHHAVSDYKWFCETLYRKKTGEFFLYGEGHAASPYARSCSDGTRSPGEKIIPLAYEAARQWAEDNLDAEEYEEIFGAVVEDDSRVAVNLSLPTNTVQKARRAAAEQGITLSAYIERLIQNEL